MRTPALLAALPLAALLLIGADSPETAPASPAPQRPDDASGWQKAYPAAKAGQKRVVIHLAAKENEDDWQVEVVVGKVMETDGVNLHRLMGGVERKTVGGWGYTYLEAPESKGALSTRMGVPPGAPKVMAFVSYPAVGPFRYNSKLPVVVYVPEGYEVRYRFWKAEGAFRTGDAG
jgi:ecotin